MVNKPTPFNFIIQKKEKQNISKNLYICNKNNKIINKTK